MTDTDLWQQILLRAQREYKRLPSGEREWLEPYLLKITECQDEIDRLFCELGGESVCTICRGACCGSGRHHFTLTNLLGYLADDQWPPSADFTRSCPFLGNTGCRLPAARRPYNCITFFCERLDGLLDLEQRSKLEDLEGSLREAYQTVARRYPGASLRGLWLAIERLGDAPVFV